MTTAPPFSTRAGGASLGVRERGRCARRAGAPRLGRRFGAIGHVRAKHRQPARVPAAHDRAVLGRPPPALRGQRPDGARPVALPRHLVPAAHPRRWPPGSTTSASPSARKRSSRAVRRRVRGVVVARARRAGRRSRRYERSAIPFSWKKVLRHEFHGLLVIAAGAFVFDAMQEAGARAHGTRTRRGSGSSRQRGAVPDLRRAQARHAAARGLTMALLSATTSTRRSDLPGWRSITTPSSRSSPSRGFPRRWPSSTGSCPDRKRRIIIPTLPSAIVA